MQTAENNGVKKIFHRVLIGPSKGAGLNAIRKTPKYTERTAGGETMQKKDGDGTDNGVPDETEQDKDRGDQNSNSRSKSGRGKGRGGGVGRRDGTGGGKGRGGGGKGGRRKQTG